MGKGRQCICGAWIYKIVDEVSRVELENNVLRGGQDSRKSSGRGGTIVLHELYLEIYDQVELSFERMKCCTHKRRITGHEEVTSGRRDKRSNNSNEVVIHITRVPQCLCTGSNNCRDLIDWCS